MNLPPIRNSGSASCRTTRTTLLVPKTRRPAPAWPVPGRSMDTVITVSNSSLDCDSNSKPVALMFRSRPFRHSLSPERRNLIPTVTANLGARLTVFSCWPLAKPENIDFCHLHTPAVRGKVRCSDGLLEQFHPRGNESFQLCEPI